VDLVDCPGRDFGTQPRQAHVQLGTKPEQDVVRPIRWEALERQPRPLRKLLCEQALHDVQVDSDFVRVDARHCYSFRDVSTLRAAQAPIGAASYR
jgi:hypothetical protein